ncbi:MAG: biopolymer transporter ExbD [Candidatus Aureabacteria bacterium]|nr:biopolymer transporter ExbD [Candidatus Auribacterota bacterium]
MKFSKDSSGEKTDFEIAPMIDVVFLLLIFFISTSSLKIQETQLGVDIPTQAGEQAQTEEIPDEVLITIKSGNRVFVNNKEYDSPESGMLDELTTMLYKLKMVYEKQGVIIDIEKGVKHGRVVDVLNACAAAKIDNISFLSED